MEFNPDGTIKPVVMTNDGVAPRPLRAVRTEMISRGRPALRNFARSLRGAVALLATTGLCLPAPILGVAHRPDARRRKRWSISPIR